jgi:hypothetical protein
MVIWGMLKLLNVGFKNLLLFKNILIVSDNGEELFS